MNKKAQHSKVPSPWGKDRMGLKVCGMKHDQNIRQVAELQPNYMGFIFYEKSPRFVEHSIPKINPSIKKTGVFVNASLNFIQQKIIQYDLQAVQLHGNESVAFCRELKRRYNKLEKIPDQIRDDKSLKNRSSLEIIKVFSIKNDFNFDDLKPYLAVVDYFLFDTKGKLHGGNGETFNWKVLENYPFEKPFFLSGGIGLAEIESIKKFQQKKLPLYAVDVNSKFETEPGEKSVEELNEFKKQLNIKRA